jgi:hypothetical protein
MEQRHGWLGNAVADDPPMKAVLAAGVNVKRNMGYAPWVPNPECPMLLRTTRGRYQRPRRLHRYAVIGILAHR